MVHAGCCSLGTRSTKSVIAREVVLLVELPGSGGRDIVADRTKPSLLGVVATIFPSGQWFLGRFFVLKRTISPSVIQGRVCLLYTSPSPRDKRQSRMPSSA